MQESSTRKHIAETIEISESFAGLKRGSITWGISGRVVNGDKHVCLYFQVNGKEFINIVAPIESRYGDDIEFVTDVIEAQDAVLRKTPYVLSTYGLVSMVQSMAQNNMKLVYVTDPKMGSEPDSLFFKDPCLN